MNDITRMLVAVVYMTRTNILVISFILKSRLKANYFS